MSTPEDELTAHLGVPLRLAAASQPLPHEALSPGERARCEAFPTAARRRDWLLGRAALKALLGTGFDTAVLAFPHPRLSLTHAGGLAFAVHAGPGLLGVGVDYEPHRANVDLRTARFFLRPAEAVNASTSATLLRLWTVKEALFKATPNNSDLVLGDYRLSDAGRRHGTAGGPRGECLRYATASVESGMLSVAVCLPFRRRRAAV